MAPDIVALQEIVRTADVDQARRLLDDEFEVVKSKEWSLGGRGPAGSASLPPPAGSIRRVGLRNRHCAQGGLTACAFPSRVDLFAELMRELGRRIG